MPNPYLDAEVTRQAQIGQLRGGQPTSNTMPVRHGNPQGDFMAHAGRFSPNPQGLDALFGDAAFRGRFPNARIHKNDWVDLGEGSGLIDSIRGFDRNTGAGEAWQWLTEADAIKGKAQERPQQPIGMHPAMDNSALTRIMAELGAASRDDQSPAAREAILQMLQGGI